MLSLSKDFELTFSETEKRSIRLCADATPSREDGSDRLDAIHYGSYR